MPAGMPLKDIRNLHLVHVLTKPLPVSPSGNYSADGPCPYTPLISFDNKFELAGGVNLPKIVWCKGGDGAVYKQLVKVPLIPFLPLLLNPPSPPSFFPLRLNEFQGNDDMRQDAVMQQIFRALDAKLKSTKETRVRGLGVRTYSIVPTSPDSGVLEWISNTMPLGEWLSPSRGNPAEGAHERCDLFSIHPSL